MAVVLKPVSDGSHSLIHISIASVALLFSLTLWFPWFLVWWGFSLYPSILYYQTLDPILIFYFSRQWASLSVVCHFCPAFVTCNSNGSLVFWALTLLLWFASCPGSTWAPAWSLLAPPVEAEYPCVGHPVSLERRLGMPELWDREHLLCLFSGHLRWWALHSNTVDTYRGRNCFTGLPVAARYTARKHMFYMGFCHWIEVQAPPNLVHSSAPHWSAGRHLYRNGFHILKGI